MKGQRTSLCMILKHVLPCVTTPTYHSRYVNCCYSMKHCICQSYVPGTCTCCSNTLLGLAALWGPGEVLTMFALNFLLNNLVKKNDAELQNMTQTYKIYHQKKKKRHSLIEIRH